jgi:hypothetical protein
MARLRIVAVAASKWEIGWREKIGPATVAGGRRRHQQRRGRRVENREGERPKMQRSPR